MLNQLKNKTNSADSVKAKSNSSLIRLYQNQVGTTKSDWAKAKLNSVTANSGSAKFRLRYNSISYG